MSDLDTKAIKARLAAGVNTTEALFENVMKSIRGVGVVLPFAQAHVIAASMNDLRHPYEADIAALLAEVERLKARLTITDELLKTAARAAREAAGVNSKTMRNLREHYLDSWMTVTRAALLAAGMTDAALDAAKGGGR